MARIFSLAVFVLFYSVGVPVSAEPKSEGEIRHLLAFVENSDCTFIRNDKEYPSKEARTHIEKKYEFVKSRVSTAEDFIKYAATESSLSGKPYTVRCNGENMTSSQWLLEELAAHRRQQTGKK